MSLVGKLFGGGGSSQSQSHSQTTTTNIDKRLVADTGAIGISADESSVSVNVNTLDGGAIAGAFDLAKSSNAQTLRGLEGVFGLASDVLTVQRDTGRQAISAADALGANALRASQNVQGAFESAANIAAGNKTLVLVAIAGVAIVAALALVPSIRKAVR